MLAPLPLQKEGRDYTFYMRDYKVETIKLLPFSMTNFLLKELESHNIWRKFKNLMKNDIPYIPNYIHISDPNLRQYEFHHILINFITRFPWHFEINLCRLLLADFFCSTQKMHISYICKTCLKELGILLKCREISYSL